MYHEGLYWVRRIVQDEGDRTGAIAQAYGIGVTYGERRDSHHVGHSAVAQATPANGRPFRNGLGPNPPIAVIAVMGTGRSEGKSVAGHRAREPFREEKSNGYETPLGTSKQCEIAQRGGNAEGRGKVKESSAASQGSGPSARGVRGALTWKRVEASQGGKNGGNEVNTLTIVRAWLYQPCPWDGKNEARNPGVE